MNSDDKSSENGIKPNKKSVIRLLGRRRKVDPLSQNTVTPSNNENIKEESCNGRAILSSSTIISQNSPSIHINNGNNLSSKGVNSRISQQIGLCCSIDNRAATPPEKLTVKYKSLPDIDLRIINEERLKNLENITKTTSESKSTHQNSATILSSFDKCINESNANCPTLSNTSPNFQSQQKSPSIVIENGHRSIAMSACRSRFRANMLANVENLQQNNLSSISIDDKRSEINDQQPNEFVTQIQTPNVEDSQFVIPTEKARKRNYLSGRLAVNSLFGPVELDRVLPKREIQIFVGTWNMNEQNPPKHMNAFVLPSGIDHIPDIIAIGTQESTSMRFEWEVSLQETLGPSHVLLHSATLGTIHLAIFIRRDLIWFCSEPEDDSFSVRPGTAFRTKGAVAISFCLFGTTMLFVTSHLTAHQEKVKERVQDVKRIIQSINLPKNLNLRNKHIDVTQNFDSVFWCGDLNFRLSEPREKVLKWIRSTKFPLPSHLPNGYLHTDQLKSVLAKGAAFKDFKEANITFPPTYKYDPGTQYFDTSIKQRTPAYTDRILYKFKSNSTGLRRGSTLTALLHSNQVECLAYDSVPSFVTSDHKPVWALFKNPIRPGFDSVPLAAGLFNREVYLEGMKRRLNNTQYTDSSIVCNIQ